MTSFIGVDPTPMKWHERFIPLLGKWLYRRRVSKMIPPFTRFIMPIVKNPGPAIEITELFAGPSLSDPVHGTVEFKFVHLNWFQRRVQRVKLWWARKRGKVFDDCWL